MDGLTQQEAAGLSECIGPLSEQGQRAVRAYWERMVWEEWVPPSQRVPGPARFREATPRERRVARRAVARIAAASGLAPVVSLRRVAVTRAGSGVAA